MPHGLHSAISGILAGGILGFGTADQSCLLRQGMSFQRGVLFRFVGCAFWLVFVVFAFGFLLFGLFALIGLHPSLDLLDRVMVRALFRLPNAGTCSIVHNSFKGTNTVLRPGESREGEGRKKKVQWAFYKIVWSACEQQSLQTWFGADDVVTLQLVYSVGE